MVRTLTDMAWKTAVVDGRELDRIAMVLIPSDLAPSERQWRTDGARPDGDGWIFMGEATSGERLWSRFGPRAPLPG